MAVEYEAGPEVVALLLENGAEVNAVDGGKTLTGKTALHYAVLNKSGHEIVKLILDKGGNVHGFPLTELYRIAEVKNVDKEVLDLLRRLE